MKLKNYPKAFGYAFSGIRHFFKVEVNAWVHTLAGLVAVSLGWLLKIDSQEWLWISLAIALVFICEMFNSALEILADRVTQEADTAIEKVKDISAAATLVASIFAVVVAAVILLPKLIQ